MVILIPSYEPGTHLVPLVRRLHALRREATVVIVDDGSGPEYTGVFAEVATAGATVLHHAENRGKGAALKTGFAFIADRYPDEDIVTADADGQHTPVDILRIADELQSDADRGTAALVLGVRDLRGDVPLRSRFGNAVARGLFRAAAGWRASDTQTGLRGIPSSMSEWARTVPGERFEYEIEMLLRLRKSGLTAREVSIETVYLEQNASSHFRPVADSLRVTLPLLAFAGSSLIAFLADAATLLLLTASLPAGAVSLVVAIVIARIVSASLNFLINRRFVFQRRGRSDARHQAVRYVLLAVLLLASNIMWMEALTGFGMPLIAAKILTEAMLFLLSYQVQRQFVFEDFSAPKERLRKREGGSIRMDTATPHLERNPR
ncbi:bifunctional glycosyltransferase family 2/GtrA family protein [Microbacterium murale]|uniref:Polysaccharide synthesis protein GtrA n=1 Tax=Microbacterium murale TaxID=1081040 RepID=A0ABQ1RHE6_9MICO|nr:bifunctional glycosyltransferase family 2/GtrA family protein [Microbacterium murale]GGD69929.1 polysaccharide synthesis protein GtrA [Microbacterium murale]